MNFFQKLIKRVSYIFIILVCFSCENELQTFPTFSYLPCEIENVIVDQNIISDFECQANFDFTNVEPIRNPKEIQVNKSKFVGKYISANEGLSIDIQNINLETNAVFRIKVNTTTENATLLARLEGGTSGIVELFEPLINDGGWVEYRLNFSEFTQENHNKFTLFFNSNSSTNEYLIDDLSFEPYIDPCDEITEYLTIINDFECQQNIEIQKITKVINPFKTTANQTTFVGQYIDGAEQSDAYLINYDNAIDLSANNIFTLKIYAPVTGQIKVKLKGGTSPEVEQIQQITTTEKWGEYSFSFLDQNDQNHKQIEVIFNDGVATNGTDKYYVDDIRFTENPCAGTIFDASYFNDFDCQLNITPDGNVVSEVVENPNITVSNSSINVLQITDNGREPFDFLLFDYGSAIDLSVKNTLKLKVHTSATIPLIAKLDGGTSASKEVAASVDLVDDWKEYTFNFESEANENHTQLLFFFNAGQINGTSLDTYFIDDIRFEEQLDCTGVTLNPFIVNDAECQNSYTIQGNVSTQIIENPNKSGLNTSSQVIEVQDNGTDAWDHLLLSNGNSIDLSSNSILKIKILSSKTVPLLAKLEGGTSNASEIWGSINVVGNWAEYTFDFSSQASENHNSLVLFFNGGDANGSNPDTYYIDDIKWE